MAFSLAQIRTLAKQESDNVNSAFVSDAEWDSYITNSYFELYGLVVQAYGNDYFVADPYVITTDGTEMYDLPEDFWKLLGVDLLLNASSQRVAVKPFTFTERNDVGFLPAPAAGQTVWLWYIPLPPAFDSGDDLPLNLGMWSEYIVIDAAMKAMAKGEEDPSVLMARKQAIITRINAESENRDAGTSTRIADVYAAGAQGMRYRLSGEKLWLRGAATPCLYGGGAFW